jgi:hypothetical protein
MAQTNHILTRISFWFFWAGTVLLPLEVKLLEATHGVTLVFIFFPPLLCLRCAQCVVVYPRLAKIGMLTLGIGALLIPIGMLLADFFWGR